MSVLDKVAAITGKVEVCEAIPVDSRSMKSSSKKERLIIASLLGNAQYYFAMGKATGIFGAFNRLLGRVILIKLDGVDQPVWVNVSSIAKRLRITPKEVKKLGSDLFLEENLKKFILGAELRSAGFKRKERQSIVEYIYKNQENLRKKAKEEGDQYFYKSDGAPVSMMLTKEGTIFLHKKSYGRTNTGYGDSGTTKKPKDAVMITPDGIAQHVVRLRAHVTGSNEGRLMKEADILKLLENENHHGRLFCAVGHERRTPLVENKETTVFSMYMKRFNEGSLRQMLRTESDRSLSSPLRLRAARDLIYSLKEMHDLGIAHCDIKFANTLYDSKEKRAVLTDFDLAVPSSVQGNISIGGTSGWYAPEKERALIARREKIKEIPGISEEEERKQVPWTRAQEIIADIWSLGKVLRKLLTWVDEEDSVGALIDKMMDPDPTKRPTIQEVVRQWDQI